MRPNDLLALRAAPQGSVGLEPAPPPLQPDVSVLVVNYNTADLIQPLMQSLQEVALSGVSMQTIVVDNASRDDSLLRLREWSGRIELIENPSNVGFGRANNQALPLARGRYILLLNTDVSFAPDTVRKTLSYMDTHTDCGVLGVRLVGRDGSLQPSCRYFPSVLNGFLNKVGLGAWLPWVRQVDDMTWDHASHRRCDWVPGCYYLVRREVIEQVGLFDPRYFLYFEEVDHCRAVKAAGWAVTYFSDATVVHIGGESAKSDSSLTSGGRQISVLQIESELLYFRKHAGLAGLLSHLALSVLGAAILSLKSSLKGHAASHVSAHWHELSRVLTIARQTRLGTVPTR